MQHWAAMSNSQQAKWLLAAIGIAVAALSIHVLMLQVLHVPYPDMRGVGSFGLVLVAGQVLALFAVCRLAEPWVGTRSLALQVGLVTLFHTMIAGNIRSAVMQAVVTESVSFPAAALALNIAENLVLATIVVLANRFVRHPAALALVALLTTALMTVGLGSVFAAAAQPFAHLARSAVHVQPYGAGVLAWSYASFLETVFAVMALACVVGPQLSWRTRIALLQFVILVLLLRGTLVMQLLFPLLMQGGIGPSALSTSQFFLQDLALALLAWWAWRSMARQLVDLHS